MSYPYPLCLSLSLQPVAPVAEELDAGTVANGSCILSFHVCKWRFMVEMQIRANELASLLAEAILCVWTIRQRSAADRHNACLDELLNEVAPEGLPPMVIPTGGRRAPILFLLAPVGGAVA